MQIGRYLQWVETAPVGSRIEAARVLVGLYEANPAAGRKDAEIALLALMDDPAAAVRRALSEAAAFAADLPRALVVSLAQDHSTVSVPVLRYSTLLADGDLVDSAAIGDGEAQAAIASRSRVSAPVAAALAEIGECGAVEILCRNPGAALPAVAAGRILARFGRDATIREALGARDDLDPALRHDLMVATADALMGFVTQADWLHPARADRFKRDCLERGTVLIAAEAGRRSPTGARQLAQHLRRSGQLTPALILRSVLSGQRGLLEAALADLSGMAPAAVAGHVRDAGGLGFASLYRRAGMPAALLPLFRAAIDATGRLGEGRDEAPRLRRDAVAEALLRCRAETDEQMGRVGALLRRLEAEALRDEARRISSSAWEDDEALPALMPWVVGPGRQPRLAFEAA